MSGAGARAMIGVAVLAAFGEARFPRQSGRVHTSIDVVLGGPPILATGDTLALVLHRYRCVGDVCELLGKHSGSVRWSSSDPRVVTVSSNGRLHGLTLGRATITARSASGSTSIDARVLSEVRALAWTSLPSMMRVGDTITLAVVARDARGREVARLAPVAHVGGTGSAGEVLWPPSDSESPLTRVVLDRAGTLVLVARLAHRVDTLRRQVLER